MYDAMWQEPHATHLVHLLHTMSTEGNPTRTKPLPSVDCIVSIAEYGMAEDVIIIAKDEMEYTDNLSLEGDIPDNILDK